MWAGLATFNAALALLLLGVRPRRVLHLVVAALFASNGALAAVLSAGEAGVLGRLAVMPLAFIAGAPSGAALFVIPLLFPRRRLGHRGERALLAAAGAVVAVTWAAVLAAPGLLLPQPLPGGGVHQPPLFWLVAVPTYAGILGGTVLFLDAYLGSPGRTQRAQAGLFLAVYALKVAVLLRFGGEALLAPPATLRGLAMPLLWLVALAVPAAIAAARVRARAGGRALDALPTDALVTGTLGLGAAMALLGLASEWVVELVRGVLFTFGILAYQVLDLEVRSRRGAMAAVVIAGTGVSYAAGQALLAGAGVDPGVAGAVGLMAALAAAWALGRALLLPLLGLTADRPATDPRALAPYVAALEAAVAEGDAHAASNERVLRALRARMGLSDREHARLEAAARAAAAHGLEVEPGRRVLGKYRVEALLGEGSFGRAYLAFDERVQRAVVLKVGRREGGEEARRMLREARILGRMGHPNIVALHDVEEVAGTPVLVLEHVPGGSVQDRLARGPLALAGAAAVADDVLAALDAAHAEGIVHRDVKPANVLLAADGRAKLADFGVARAPAGSGTASGVSLEGVHPGSLRYMSPEQVRGLPLGPRSDLYAVGVLLYECLAGRSYLRLEGKPEFDVRLAILQDPPWLPLRGVPGPVNALLARALAKDPAARPPDAAAFRRELSAALAPAGEGAPGTARRRGRAPAR